ncbi:glutaminase A [Novispirillum sp. DQ9]|uniref:glutaminase A n=1 Tax=Novispirillum sp. DQ9 TaxID=3398612 RepID=UPI003C7EAD37
MNHAIRPQARPSVITACLEDLHARYAGDTAGAPASYIPELAKADPSLFGVALVTADGRRYAVGDSTVPFTIQSISKAFVYGLALEDHGLERVLRKVGVEPSGDAFNAIVFDQRTNRPFNPMVNAGAIATSALIKGDGVAERMGRIAEMFRKYTGRVLDIDETVYASEAATGHRNRAIAWLMLNSGMIDARVDEHLEVYFRQCSLLVTAEDLAMMAATLANGGVNPVTGEQALRTSYVKYVTAVMASCGMYDYAGEWSYRIGLPAKSGVGGGIVAVLPGQMGIGTFSPPLDERGNSVRGIRACEDLSQRFGLHVFDTSRSVKSAVARTYTGDKVRSKRMRCPRQAAFLDAEGRRIAALEVQGDLFFGAAEQVLRHAAEAAATASHVILDLHRVGRIDAAAAALLHRLWRDLEDRGLTLEVAAAADPARSAPLRTAGLPERVFCATLDDALEAAENRVLAALPPLPGAGDRVPLAELELLAGMDPADLETLAASLVPEHHAAGSIIIAQGEAATALHFLVKGEAAIRMPLPDGRSVRLATVMPGVAFGEMALLDGGRRSADVRAESDCDCLRLDVDRLHALAAERPAIGLAVMRNLGRMLSGRLRRANDELRALAE